MNSSIYKKGLAVVLIIALITMTFIGIKIAGKEKELLEFTDSISDNNVENTEETVEKNNESNVIIVDIDGAVMYPGVYEFKEGSRVNDAIVKAGGLLDKAYTKNVNKARLLTDGEKLYIFEEGEEKTVDEIVVDSSYYAGEGQGIVNINTASKELLMTLDGIGEVYAQRIIEYRNKLRFVTVEEIKKIKGIGERTFEKIKSLISVN